MQRHTILVVDDEPDIVQSVKELLRKEFRVLGATSAAEGLRVMEMEDVHLVMTDQRMPGITGVEFLRLVKESHPDAVRLIFTGYADIRAVINAINQGSVFRYINKPWDPDELVSILREAAERYDMTVHARERIFFESALRRYLAAPLVEDLIKDPARLRLGGEKRDVTVAFFDVADFTTIAEALPVDELVALVNGYLDGLVEAIFRHEGTLDKFIGDAVMAFWGAPIAQPDHPLRALRAAVDMQRSFRGFAQRQSDPRLQRLRARIGLHRGVAALGNLGSSTIMNYTVMGDTVNVASRLEHLNKQYGTAICTTEETLLGTGWTAARELDMVRVKGRTLPLRIFEVWDPDGAGDDGPAPADARDAYAAGLTHYRARRFDEARASFEGALALGDRPCARVMADRAAALAETKPADDWDGVYNQGG